MCSCDAFLRTLKILLREYSITGRVSVSFLHHEGKTPAKFQTTGSVIFIEILTGTSSIEGCDNSFTFIYTDQLTLNSCYTESKLDANVQYLSQKLFNSNTFSFLFALCVHYNTSM